ncbi:MAG TPA: hypothetical protein VGI79_13240 [Caulobacteraceae bacterium]
MLKSQLSGERIVVHAPEGTQLAIGRAAINANLKPAQFLRRLVLDGLEANGFQLPRRSDEHVS